ncbi:DUF302 domain-containing protein [Pontibacter sp. JH31]|uniref:DUF302 domain-containing protein n=1 Tax=Pontibacter aquaedesilientis TaxID=2766980 RepID=A0ABR7XDT7_9BACT|nr:DUF302 domain-containing protein [Pontibacter aquaedesilientis]MBD1396459.1 DUF302 domain-containing protein [Pontibacter aquaedesilientis]
MKKTVKNCLFGLLCLNLATIITGCNDNDDLLEEDKPTAIGLAYTQAANRNLDTVYNDLVNALSGNSAIGIVAEVNHQQNAANAGLELNPTRVVLFGNPALGTPLMQANQQAGLDLPQNILLYQNVRGDVYATFNTVQYLASRHGVDTVSTLPKISTALTNLTETATGSSIQMPENETVALNEGVISIESVNSFADSYSKLRASIEANSNLKLVAELDHQQNAQSVGMALRPTKLIVFGNPNLGTPLMKAEQTIGIDLPQKMLVYEDKDGKVYIAYNDPQYLAERHGISGETETLVKISTALSKLATEAAQ